MLLSGSTTRPAPVPDLPEPRADRPPLLLRHRGPRLAGGRALRLEGVRRRPPRGGERLPGPARLRDVPSDVPLHPRVRPARRGRREDPQPQRPDRPGPAALRRYFHITAGRSGHGSGTSRQACDRDRGSLGIGKAIARELAREGVDVAIVARTKAQLEATARSWPPRPASESFRWPPTSPAKSRWTRWWPRPLGSWAGCTYWSIAGRRREARPRPPAPSRPSSTRPAARFQREVRGGVALRPPAIPT